MPEGTTPDAKSSESQPTPPAPNAPTPPAAAPPPPAAPTQQQAAPQRQGKVIPIPADRFSAMRKEEREKGQKQLRQQLDTEAKALGYESHAQMLEAIKQQRQQPHNAGAPSMANNNRQNVQHPKNRNQNQNRNQDGHQRQNGGGNNNRSAREIERLRVDNQRLTKQLNASERKRREAERQRDKEAADAVLRESAARAGLVDIEYALHLIKKDPKVLKMTKEERQAFDEVAYFEGLRESHPSLFGVQRAPATTSPAAPPPAKQPPAPPLAPHTPTEPTPPPNGAGPKDARQLTDAQFKDRLRTLGINPDAPM